MTSADAGNVLHIFSLMVIHWHVLQGVRIVLMIKKRNVSFIGIFQIPLLEQTCCSFRSRSSDLNLGMFSPVL